MAYIDFLSALHKSTARDYLARVNDTEYPKAKAADLAKKRGFDYWDGAPSGFNSLWMRISRGPGKSSSGTPH